MSVATNASGVVVSNQHFDPWGKVRTGGVGATRRGFTGQYLDESGVMYYNARYYDPTLGRFISPDTVVPGAAILTINGSSPSSGPADPQHLNRFAYVTNNPLRYTDPTGHWLQSAINIAFITYDLYDIHQNGLTWTNGLALAADVASLALPAVAGGGALVRAAAHGDEVVDAARIASSQADDVAEAARVTAQNTSEDTRATLFRAVSPAELADLSTTGQFRPAGNSVEGKYFAESAEQAQAWGELMPGGREYSVVQASVRNTIPHVRWEKLDGIGPARFYPAEELPHIRYHGEVPR